jgi:hypothetical protein
MSSVHPTFIIDKNGKGTTVHKKVDASEAPLRLGGARPYQPNSETKQIGILHDMAHDYRVLIPGAEYIEIGSDDSGDPFTNRALDADGQLIWSEAKDQSNDSIYDMDRALRNLDIQRGYTNQYISNSRNAPGTILILDLSEMDKQ